MVNIKSKSICKVIESDLIEKKVSDLQSSEIVYLFLEEIDNDFDEFKKSFFERHQFDLNAEPFNRFLIICNCWVANPPMESAIIKETFTLLEVYRKIAFSCKNEIEQLFEKKSESYEQKLNKLVKEEICLGERSNHTPGRTYSHVKLSCDVIEIPTIELEYRMHNTTQRMGVYRMPVCNEEVRWTKENLNYFICNAKAAIERSLEAYKSLIINTYVKYVNECIGDRYGIKRTSKCDHLKRG